MNAAHHIAALPVAIPLLTAAAIVMTAFVPRAVHVVMGLAAAVATTVLCAILLADTRSGPIVEWLGGWRPHHQVALGISLAIDQIGAGMATLAAALVTAGLVFAVAYFERLSELFEALMLVFLAGMVGFCLSGDLFNMIIFFTLMGVAAYALTAFEIGQPWTIQGGINFAVTNSIAGFAALFGIALIYGRTGALNLAQIGAALGHRADTLVVVAFALVGLAFLTKAAVVPFHFWLPDAHAVAPVPISAVFSGVMAEIGVLGLARLLATAFSTPLAAHAGDIRAVLVAVGVASALLGGLACFEQRHIKRMLGFATVSHVGVILCGVALLDDRALGGAALYTIGFGGAVAALFLATGMLASRYGTVDEYELHGRARDLGPAALVFAAGGLALACAPLVTTYFGAALIGSAARAVGYGWLPWVLAAAWALTGATALRVTGRVFLGLGAAERMRGRPDESEEESQERAASEGSGAISRTVAPATLAVMPAFLLVSVVLAVIPGFVPSVVQAAAHFRDFAAYKAAVLAGVRPAYRPVAVGHVGTIAIAIGFASTAAAVAIAALALFGRGLAERLPRPLAQGSIAVVDVLRAAHSGHVGDYVAWWTFGLAVIGGLLVWTVAG